jgi:hypothetical protein
MSVVNFKTDTKSETKSETKAETKSDNKAETKRAPTPKKTKASESIRKPELQSSKPSANQKRRHPQTMAAMATGTIAGIITALSLTHLAHGIQIVTHAPEWEAWAMAIGIDLGFIALEMALLCTPSDTTRQSVSRYANPAIIGTLATSAAMNAFTFSANLEGFLKIAPAIVLGLAIPAMIYALTRITATLWLDADHC